ncbi:DUF7701 domain-containing protein [Streptomyces stelliscabiei]
MNSARGALVPYKDLDPDTRAADAPYAEAVRAAARRTNLDVDQ